MELTTVRQITPLVTALQLLHPNEPIGTLTWDLTQQTICCDAVTTTLLGLDGNEIILPLASFLLYIHKQDCDALLAVRDSERADMAVQTCEIRIWHEIHAQWRWWQLTAQQHCVENEQWVLCAAVLDVSNRHSLQTLQHDLASAGERLRIVQANVPFSTSFWDSNATLFDCNEETFRMFGFTKREDFLEHFDEISPKYQPDGQLSTLKSRELVRRALTGENIRTEWNHIMTDGELVPCELHLIRADTSDGPTVVAYVRDRRESVQRQAELERQRQFLEMILGSCPVVFAVIKDGIVLYQNAAADDRFGNHVGEMFWTEADRQKAFSHFQVEKHEPWYATQLLDKQSNVCEVLISVFPVDYYGNAAHIAWVVDVTEMHKTQAALLAARDDAEASARSKTVFLANMSHEIRTPMNAIVGMSELLSLSPMTPAQQSYVDSIKGASASLLKLINDILDFSKIDAGKTQLEVHNFNFLTLLCDVINIINIKALEKDITFVVHMTKNIPAKINSDQLRIMQVLVNVLNNAVKFTREGFVRLAVSHQSAEDGKIILHFEVEDSGIGIKKADVAKLFKEFEQFDSRRNRNLSGTGLGLAISKRLVELMGGKISVESQYSEGTKVRFSVVVGCDDPEPLAEVIQTAQKSVLCYEPNVHAARAVIAMCEEYDINCELCEDVESLIEGARSGQYTHALFDYRSCQSAAQGLLTVPKSTMLVAMKSARDFLDDTQLLEGIYAITKPLLLTTFAKIMNQTLNRGGIQMSQKQGDGIGSFQTHDCRVLVVDDNAVNLKVASALLHHYNIAVDEAMSGFEALSYVRHTEYDLIFMDHMMPEMDGLDCTKAIRALGGRFEAMPIVALTANAIYGMREVFLESGMNDFLSKPIDSKTLTRVLLNNLPNDKIIRKEGLGTPLPPASPALLLQLQHIPSLDTAKGLSHVAGDIEAYERVLLHFVYSTKTQLARMQQLIESNQPDQLGIEIHGLKSALTNIGAVREAAIASDLEKRYHKGEPLPSGVTRLSEQVQQLISQIDAQLTHRSSSATKRGDRAFLHAKAPRLLQHLQQLEMDSVITLLSEISSFSYGAPIDALLHETAIAVEHFDTSKAEELCAQLLQHTN